MSHASGPSALRALITRPFGPWGLRPLGPYGPYGLSASKLASSLMDRGCACFAGWLGLPLEWASPTPDGRGLGPSAPGVWRSLRLLRDHSGLLSFAVQPNVRWPLVRPFGPGQLPSSGRSAWSASDLSSCRSLVGWLGAFGSFATQGLVSW